MQIPKWLQDGRWINDMELHRRLRFVQILTSESRDMISSLLALALPTCCNGKVFVPRQRSLTEFRHHLVDAVVNYLA
jgi:hypothetical protein